MANNVKQNPTEKTALATKLNTDIGINATVNIYGGTQPTDASVAAGSSALVTWAMNATAFGAVSGATLTATTPATASPNAAVSGTAAWGRVATSGGVGVIDFTVGATASDMNLSTGTTITAGSPVLFSAFSYTFAN